MYIEKTAYALERNDEEPNINLAVELVKKNSKSGVLEIVNGLKSAQVQTANDCIKVLYEIGERKPELIADFASDFIELLHSRNNRLVWGGMTALTFIADLKPDEIYKKRESIIRAYNRGSVITIDNSITVFAKLIKANKTYAKTITPILLNHFQKCRAKEIPQHIERAFLCINANNCEEFKDVLQKRYNELTDSQKKRVDKIIKKIDKKEFDQSNKGLSSKV